MGISLCAIHAHYFDCKPTHKLHIKDESRKITILFYV